MSTVAEIEAALAKLTPAQLCEVADLVQARIVPRETPAMLAALDAGIRSLESAPGIAAEDVRRKIRGWATE